MSKRYINQYPILILIDINIRLSMINKLILQNKTWKKNEGYLKNKKNSLHVVAIDYGIKKNILRYFSDFNCKVTIVSCKTSAREILKLKQILL